jgi:hypothetical protein
MTPPLQLWALNPNGTVTSDMDGACLDVFDFAGPSVQAYPCNGQTPPLLWTA